MPRYSNISSAENPDQNGQSISESPKVLMNDGPAFRNPSEIMSDDGLNLSENERNSPSVGGGKRFGFVTGSPLENQPTSVKWPAEEKTESGLLEESKKIDLVTNYARDNGLDVYWALDQSNTIEDAKSHIDRHFNKGELSEKDKNKMYEMLGIEVGEEKISTPSEIDSIVYSPLDKSNPAHNLPPEVEQVKVEDNIVLNNGDKVTLGGPNVYEVVSVLPDSVVLKSPGGKDFPAVLSMVKKATPEQIQADMEMSGVVEDGLKQFYSKNPYEVLGVSEDSRISEIRSKRNELMKKYHPDINSGNQEISKMINNAYDQILKERSEQGKDQVNILGKKFKLLQKVKVKRNNTVYVEGDWILMDADVEGESGTVFLVKESDDSIKSASFEEFISWQDMDERGEFDDLYEKAKKDADEKGISEVVSAMKANADFEDLYNKALKDKSIDQDAKDVSDLKQENSESDNGRPVPIKFEKPAEKEEELGLPSTENVKLEERNIPTAEEAATKRADEIVGRLKTQEKYPMEENVSVPPPPTVEGAGGVDVENFDEIYKEAERIEENLENARVSYATALVEFKNSHRAKKNKFAKLMLDLGMEKQMPKSDEIPDELKALEDAYIEAKKEKSRYLFSKGVQKERVLGDGMITSRAESYNFNVEMVEEMEKEYKVFFEKVNSNIPPLEKGIVLKSLEKWQKMSLLKRTAISSVLVTGAAFGAGFVPLAGVAAYGGYRAARALGGTALGQGVGKLVESKFQNKNIVNREAAFNKYAENITEENFAQKEKEMAGFFESEANEKKRQRLYKAGAVLATAGASSVGSGALLSSIDDIMYGGAKAEMPQGNVKYPTLPESKISSTPKITADESIPSSAVEVELSSKGFIRTFDDMKTKLLETYGSTDKVPEHLKYFAETPSTKLAQDFGMYDPKKGLSSIGMKGDSLSLDDKGNLLYEKIGGKKDVLFDVETGEKSTFDGQMIDSSGNVVNLETADSNLPVDSANEEMQVSKNETILEQSNSNTAQANMEKIFEIQGKPFAFPGDFEYNGHKLNLSDYDGKKVLVYGNEAIAQEVENPNSGSYPMVLADGLQDGSQFRDIREAFVAAQDKMIEGYGNPKNLLTQGVPFEGGKIHVVVDQNSTGNTDVYLNGKHIANGILNDKNSDVVLDDKLGRGFLGFVLADNAYERALSEVKKNVLPQMSTLLKS